MKNITAIGASNSKLSINKQLATFVAEQVENTTVTVLDLNDYDLPLYGVDLEEASGIPEAAQKLSKVIDQSDGIVLSLAEHNGSFTVAFKNAVDWLSRIDTKLWKGKPMLLMATSPGGRGGTSVLKAAQELYPHQGANVIASFSLPSFYHNFSDAGINDENLTKDLAQKIELFARAL